MKPIAKIALGIGAAAGIAVGGNKILPSFDRKATRRLQTELVKSNKIPDSEIKEILKKTNFIAENKNIGNAWEYARGINDSIIAGGESTPNKTFYQPVLKKYNDKIATKQAAEKLKQLEKELLESAKKAVK